MCTTCGKGSLTSYSDKEDSWEAHGRPVAAFVRLVSSWVQDISWTDVLRCSNCNRYGFKCPYCSELGVTDSLPTHGQKRVCISCRKDFIMRNPSNFFSLK